MALKSLAALETLQGIFHIVDTCEKKKKVLYK